MSTIPKSSSTKKICSIFITVQKELWETSSCDPSEKGCEVFPFFTS